MATRIGIIALLLILMGISVYVLVSRRSTDRGIVVGATITISGETECLPVKDPNKPHIELCAIGLKGDDGKHYGLKSLSDIFETGIRITITGTMSASDPETIYNTVGDILVESYTKE